MTTMIISSSNKEKYKIEREDRKAEMIVSNDDSSLTGTFGLIQSHG